MNEKDYWGNLPINMTARRIANQVPVHPRLTIIHGYMNLLTTIANTFRRRTNLFQSDRRDPRKM